MLWKSLAVIAAVLMLGGLTAGCAKTRCETVCDWVDECVIDVDQEECIEECVEEADDSGCADALKELASCIDDSGGCGSSVEDCGGESYDFEAECN